MILIRNKNVCVIDCQPYTNLIPMVAIYWAGKAVFSHQCFYSGVAEFDRFCRVKV